MQNKLQAVTGQIQGIKNICKEEIIIHGSGRTVQRLHGTKQVFILILQEKCLKRSGNGQLIIFTK